MPHQYQIKQEHYHEREAHAFDTKWTRYNKCTYRLLRTLLEQLEEAPQRILDIGCGTGNALCILQQYFPSAELTGVDPSRAMLDKAQRKIPEAYLVEGDMHDAPEATYDLIVSVSMFHYVSDPRHWLRCAANLLRPDGILLLIDWNGSFPLMRLRKKWLLRLPHIAHIHTTNEMKHLLSKWQEITSMQQSCCMGWWGIQGFLARAPHATTTHTSETCACK